MRPIFLVALGVSAPLALIAAQTPARPQNPPTFTAGIDLVKLDVSVYDKNHRPIKGLTAADFTVLEDKLPRPIDGFSEIDIPEPPAPTAKWMRDATDDVATNDVADKRLFVIVIDDHSFNKQAKNPDPFDPPQWLSFKANRDAIIDAAKRVIDRLGPTDLAAVVYWDDARTNQEFTNDHRRLIAAVENGLKQEPYYNFLNDTAADVYTAVNNLINVPAKRKAIVDITNGLTCMTGFDLATAEHIFTAALRSGARFYMLRPAAHVPDCGGPMGSAGVDHIAQDSLFLTRAPLETGGEAFVNVANPEAAEAAAAAIFDANSSYYMLGYTSADLQKIHFVKVLVDRPDAEVKTRPRYWPPAAAESAPKGPPPAATVAAMSGLLPKGDVPLRASVAAFAPIPTAPGGSRAAATVVAAIQVRQIRAEGKATPIRERLDLRAAAFTSDGDARGSATRTADIRLPAGTDDVTYEIFQTIDVPKPGVYELRLSTHSGARNADGSVYVTIDVPDFAKEPLSLSHIVLSADNGLAIDGADLFKTLLPVTPTVVRVFDRGEAVTAFVRAYEGGSSPLRPVAVHTRLISEHDVVVLDRNEAVAPAQFDRARSAQLYTRLPTADLPPGPYLLTIEATRDKSMTKQEIKFSVR